MIKIENYEVVGWKHAIRGMRNPMNSWDKSDSEPGCEIVKGSHEVCRECDNASYIYGNIACLHGCEPEYTLGPNDHDLMMRLAKAGPVHGKFRRMITVYVDITAPLYWWKEFDTYKVGTVANSCSTMHKIHEKEFTMDDFSTEHLMDDEYFSFPLGGGWRGLSAIEVLKTTIEALNNARKRYLEVMNHGRGSGKTEFQAELAKRYWWQMIQLLPSSYNQKRTVQLNYEVLANIYEYRKNHKLDEWREFCEWIETLPYSEVITGEREESK